MTEIITFLIAGIVLLVVEIFLPGMIAGILGGICLLVAVVLTFTTFGPEEGFILLFAELVFAVILFSLWLKFFPKSRVGRAFSIDLPGVTPAMPSPGDLAGATGRALTVLRPSGAALINGHRVDVTTEGTLIEAGADIKVAKVEGARIIVRRL